MIEQKIDRIIALLEEFLAIEKGEVQENEQLRQQQQHNLELAKSIMLRQAAGSRQ